ncbi:MAG: Sterol desaturase, partial [Porphyrobacter sp. HL-46]
HHSQDYEATRSNYSATWIIWDRIFGTCIDGEAELLGMEGGRRMDIRETMVFPFVEGYKSIRSWMRGRVELPEGVVRETEPAE